jgi:hypothetical protein
MPETRAERLERLTQEALDLIPKYTPRRGSFNSVPEMGYDARNPGEWQREFLQVLDSQLLDRLKPDTGDIVALIQFVHWCEASWPHTPMYQRADGSAALIPITTLSSILGYALSEMLLRKLLRIRRGSSLTDLLALLQRRRPIPDLASDLACLNDRMRYEERGDVRDLHWRLDQGRGQLLHGNVLRSSEPEGHLLVLLIDLIALHMMRHSLQAAPER